MFLYKTYFNSSPLLPIVLLSVTEHKGALLKCEIIFFSFSLRYIAFSFVVSLINIYLMLILLCSSFLSFKASLSPFYKTQRTLDGLYPRVAQTKSLAVHLVPLLLLSLCTLTIGAFIQLLRRFGLSIFMEETVSRALYMLKQCHRRERNLLQTISHSIYQ